MGVGREGGEVKATLDPWLDPSVVSGCLLNGGASPSKCPPAGSDCLSPCPLLLPSSPRCRLMPVTLGLRGHTGSSPLEMSSAEQDSCLASSQLEHQGLNIEPTQSRYSSVPTVQTETRQLWPSGPHFMNGKVEAQRRGGFRSSGSSHPWPVLYVWAPFLGQGLGSSPHLPWKEVMMLKK